MAQGEAIIDVDRRTRGNAAAINTNAATIGENRTAINANRAGIGRNTSATRARWRLASSDMDGAACLSRTYTPWPR